MSNGQAYKDKHFVYTFESGHAVHLTIPGGVDTGLALEILEALIRIKREELARKGRRADLNAPIQSASAEDRAMPNNQ